MAEESPLFRRFNAAELARATGITPRRVRYYVREKLIEAPLGRGRGRHYDYRHIYQVRRVLRLSEAGLSHVAIRADGDKLRRALAEERGDRRPVEFDRSGLASQDKEDLVVEARRLVGGDLAEAARIIRLRLAPGIELLVDEAHGLLEPELLAGLVQAALSAFGPVQDPSETAGRAHGERR